METIVGVKNEDASLIKKQKFYVAFYRVESSPPQEWMPLCQPTTDKSSAESYFGWILDFEKSGAITPKYEINLVSFELEVFNFTELKN